MSTLVKIDKDYANWIKDISQRFRCAQIKASVKVNNEMLLFYWSLGKDIIEKHAEERWKSNFWKNISNDLQTALPGVRSFSITNLQYIRRFYLLYNPLIDRHPQLEGAKDGYDNKTQHPQLGGASVDVVQIITSIPWGHNKVIIDKCYDNPEKAVFYVVQTLKYNWSRNVLLNFLDTDLFERYGKSVNNFSVTLPKLESDLAKEIVKDPYNFDFAGLTEPYNEKELKDALIKNIERFLLEMGNGFAYMGRKFRMEVSGTEFFTDMLFYNTKLHCYVIVEVKTQDFNPSFLGQLSGYVSFANHLLKGDGDNPTVGLLVCKSKNDVVARYALEGYTQPLGISEYELSKLYPKDFKSSLPSIEEIERELK